MNEHLQANPVRRLQVSSRAMAEGQGHAESRWGMARPVHKPPNPWPDAKQRSM